MPCDPTTQSSSPTTARPHTPPCPWCGYNLSGLANIGPHAPQVCPECGGDVRDAGFALARTRSRIRQRRLRVIMLITSSAAYAFLLIMSIANDRMPNARLILATAIATLTVLIPTAFALVSRDAPSPHPTTQPVWQRCIVASAIAALYLIASAGLTLIAIQFVLIISALR